MKRLFTLMAISFAMVLTAQERPKISSAVIDLDQNKDLMGAKKYIDEAADIINSKDLSLVKEKDLTKFYYYHGLIYYRLAADSAHSKTFPDAIDKSAKSFTSLMAYEAKTGNERYGDDARNNQLLSGVAILYSQRGIASSQTKDYMGAYQDFLNSYEIKKEFNIGVDTSMYYNAALMAQNAEQYDKALAIYKELIDMNYRGVQYFATSVVDDNEVEFPSRIAMQRQVDQGAFKNPRVDGDVRPQVYLTAANLYKEQGDTAQYDALVAEGRTKFPADKGLLIAQLQNYLDNEEYDKALSNLNEAIEKDPENVIMHYNKGVILQNEMQRYDDALKSYEDALAIDPDYSDALYMSSIIYIDKANEVTQQMNELPLNATTKYKELQKEKDDIFNKALPYLEKAYKVNPEDDQVETALMQVYRALKMYEKAQALEAGKG